MANRSNRLSEVPIGADSGSASGPSASLSGTSGSLPVSERIERALRAVGVWVALAILVIAVVALEPKLLSGSNITVVLRQASIIGLLAVGQTVVLLTGGIDLSVGSVLAVVNWVSTALLAGSDRLDAPVIAACLAIGAGVGIVNGVGVMKLRVPPFVMTLGTLFAVQAGGLIYTGGVTRGQASNLLKSLGNGDVGPIPAAFVLFAVVLVATHLATTMTPWGRRLYATGANPRAAYMAGIDQSRVVIASYVLCGVTASLAGLVVSGYIGTGDNTSGTGMELESIAAAVIGGALLTGGRGSLTNTLGGVLFLSLLYSLLVVLNMAESGRLIVQGSVIVLAAAIYARSASR